jgi:hypothetical protein
MPADELFVREGQTRNPSAMEDAQDGYANPALQAAVPHRQKRRELSDVDRVGPMMLSGACLSGTCE